MLFILLSQMDGAATGFLIAGACFAVAMGYSMLAEWLAPKITTWKRKHNGRPGPPEGGE